MPHKHGHATFRFSDQLLIGAHGASLPYAYPPAFRRLANGEKPEAAGKAATEKAKPKKANGEQKPKRVSALDAAAQVLAKAEKPMRAQELISAMAEQDLWKSPGGKTPHATLYAAMLREIGKKGAESVGFGLYQGLAQRCGV